jgi:hypothetical protein
LTASLSAGFRFWLRWLESCYTRFTAFSKAKHHTTAAHSSQCFVRQYCRISPSPDNAHRHGAAVPGTAYVLDGGTPLQHESLSLQIATSAVAYRPYRVSRSSTARNAQGRFINKRESDDAGNDSELCARYVYRYVAFSFYRYNGSSVP